MNLGIEDSVRLVEELKAKVKDVSETEILICPSFVALKKVSSLLKKSNIELGCQNICSEEKGAFTGEVSAAMVKEVGCKYAIIGHSERRHVYKENDEVINKKIKIALAHKLKPIFCVGETLAEREAGKINEIISSQVKNGLRDISKDEILKMVIAYEPVWAIGTGKNATPLEAQEVHVLIRNLVKELFNEKVSAEIRILYGGSVKPDNIKDLMMQSDIDGALVGGASLKADDFEKIVKF